MQFVKKFDTWNWNCENFKNNHKGIYNNALLPQQRQCCCKKFKRGILPCPIGTDNYPTYKQKTPLYVIDVSNPGQPPQFEPRQAYRIGNIWR